MNGLIVHALLLIELVDTSEASDVTLPNRCMAGCCIIMAACMGASAVDSFVGLGAGNNIVGSIGSIGGFGGNTVVAGFENEGVWPVAARFLAWLGVIDSCSLFLGSYVICRWAATPAYGRPFNIIVWSSLGYS